MAMFPDQFFGRAPAPQADADVLIAPVPFERTVTYGTGTFGGPSAILDVSRQLELFDEETLVDFTEYPSLFTLPPFLAGEAETPESFVQRLAREYEKLRGRFVVTLGGEHTLTYGPVMGLAEDPARLTIVHVDAHADLADTLLGLRWSHGTVMRRLWEKGCGFIQAGIRSGTREEYELARTGERIRTWYAHELPERWDELIQTLSALDGDVYLSFDYDGLDPSVIPSTGTPQPDGLSWRQATQLLKALCDAPCRLIGADFVEFIPSPNPPGCDTTAAKLIYKFLAYYALAQAR